MIVSIHQPNYIPWLGYFDKIATSDIFVIIDHVQFVKGSICNRNKIKNTNGKEYIITVPVKLSKGSFQAFNEIEIDYSQNWRRKHLSIIRTFYQQARYFNDYFLVFEDIINTKYPNLAELNITLIKFFCKSLDIKTPIYIFSELGIDIGKKNEMNISIVKYFQGDTYLSGSGAKNYNDHHLFRQNNICLSYQEFNHPVYPQLHGEFISQLSVIDLLFNCGPKSLNIIRGTTFE